MRAPHAFSTLLAIAACGGSDEGASVSFSSQPSDPTATTEAADTGLATTPTGTTGEPATTTSASATGNDTEPTPTTGPADPDTDSSTETGAADTTDSAADSSTGPVRTSDTDTDTDDTTGAPCPEGQLGCPCGAGDQCDAGLACAQGLCGPGPKCGDGELDPGEACDDGPGNGDNNACKLDCTLQKCGDGKLGPGEQCDDGNQVNGDGCEGSCVKTPMQAKDACGFDTDGVWFEIDYSNAFSVSNPDYKYSPTPGWGEAQWAPTGKDWPYAVDLFNNAKVIDDQIGTVALLDGTNKAVRVYFGLTGLNYTYATVCVEGRSYSVGSSVQFTIMEAKSKCQNTGSMANDWSIHATGVDMQDCFLPGDAFQAVQVQPSGGSGSLSLTRLRVTLHGATY